MEKFEFIFNANILFENDEDHFNFEGSRVNIYREESNGKLISELGVIIEKENEECARKLAYTKMEDLNNFFIFKKGSSLIKLPLEHKEIKFLDRKTQTVTKALGLRYDIRNKVFFNKLLDDYEKYKSIRKIINIYSDAEKVYDKELKFLVYYKALEFKNKPDDWLEEKGEVIISSSHRGGKTTRLKALRDNICHPCGKNTEITKEDLNKIKKFAKERIKELSSLQGMRRGRPAKGNKL